MSEQLLSHAPLQQVDHDPPPNVHIVLTQGVPIQLVGIAAPDWQTLCGALSTVPLQSLSMASPHVSATGWFVWAHASAPFVQASAPFAQGPCLPGTAQAAPPPGLPSSITPLQLSSMLLQISAAGWTVCGHERFPFEQAVALCAQGPDFPGTVHGAPPVCSSVAPLQLSSTPLQVSGMGIVVFVHVITPLLQADVPSAQAPSPPVMQA
jgi:hypothetical protein